MLLLLVAPIGFQSVYFPSNLKHFIWKRSFLAWRDKSPLRLEYTTLDQQSFPIDFDQNEQRNLSPEELKGELSLAVMVAEPNREKKDSFTLLARTQSRKSHGLFV